jgi:gamma-glutamyl:cysteine ligase YbdK (ATP-grasp superfamily)
MRSAAEALGCADELERVDSILERGNGAEEQLRLYDDPHDLHAVTRWLVDKTTSHQLSATSQH